MRLYDSIVKCIPIEYGWSGDRKYCAVTDRGERVFLRTADISRLERKKREFQKMKEVEALGIPMCRPLEIGTTDEGVYVIHSWIEGTDAEGEIGRLSDAEQYRYGLDAGRILKKIHSIPAPEDAPDWETRFNAKIDRKIEMYRDCGLKYEDGEAFLNYLARNRHLLSGRPQSYQHGDYHVGNMMIDRNGKLTVIDFDRDDFGDPWEEFNRIVWSAQAAPSFASGMVDGYFDAQVPEAFWRLLALYMSSNALGSLPWAMNFGEAEVRVMLNQGKQILSWYEGMTRVVPRWYNSKGK